MCNISREHPAVKVFLATDLTEEMTLQEKDMVELKYAKEYECADTMA